MNNQVILTQDGFEKLKNELHELKNIKRPKILERLKKARGMGDLSENSDYHSAKEELSFLDQRIEEIQRLLDKAKVVMNNSNNNQTVGVGSRVIVENDGEKEEFYIVGEMEGDPVNKKISYSSPLGKALFGRKVGEVVEVEVPAGKMVYKILEIKR